MKTTRQRPGGFSLLELLVVITIIGLLSSMAMSAIHSAQVAAHMAVATNNSKQIVLALKSYAADHHGLYPDANRKNPPSTANDAFRLLFQNGSLKDERIFSSPVSPYQPDGDFGGAPEFEKALEAGENHWCLVKGISDATDGTAPVVFENAMSTSWPPAWNATASGRPVEGRAWSGGRIIVARNDGSSGPERLESSDGNNVGLKSNDSGKNLFTLMSEEGSFLDIQR
ncbi:MAG: type II secretion system protein [Verrucomicrobiaceae bacterium]|nr:type II secretion system protein [Verrucomicrobiaceae bacterium]